MICAPHFFPIPLAIESCVLDGDRGARLGVSCQVDRAEAADGELLVDLVAAVQDGAGGGGQGLAAALAVALAGRIGDAARRIGAEVQLAAGEGP